MYVACVTIEFACLRFATRLRAPGLVLLLYKATSERLQDRKFCSWKAAGRGRQSTFSSGRASVGRIVATVARQKIVETGDNAMQSATFKPPCVVIGIPERLARTLARPRGRAARKVGERRAGCIANTTRS